MGSRVRSPPEADTFTGRRSSMTMKAHANYIIFGRPPIGGNLPPPGGATGIGPSRASAHASFYTDKQILHD